MSHVEATLNGLKVKWCVDVQLSHITFPPIDLPMFASSNGNLCQLNVGFALISQVAWTPIRLWVKIVGIGGNMALDESLVVIAWGNAARVVEKVMVFCESLLLVAGSCARGCTTCRIRQQWSGYQNYVGWWYMHGVKWIVKDASKNIQQW